MHHTSHHVHHAGSGAGVPVWSRSTAAQWVWPACAGQLVALSEKNRHSCCTPDWHKAGRFWYPIDTNQHSRTSQVSVCTTAEIHCSTVDLSDCVRSDTRIDPPGLWKTHWHIEQVHHSLHGVTHEKAPGSYPRGSVSTASTRTGLPTPHRPHRSTAAPTAAAAAVPASTGHHRAGTAAAGVARW